jgi:hypothetical protein
MIETPNVGRIAQQGLTYTATRPQRRRRTRRSTPCSGRGQSGTRAGRPPPRCRPRSSRGATPPAEVGTVRHRGGSERMPGSRREASGEVAAAHRTVVGPKPDASRPSHSSPAALSRFSPPSAPSCRSRGPATSTTRVARRSPSQLPRTSATARTPSPRSSRSRRRNPVVRRVPTRASQVRILPRAPHRPRVKLGSWLPGAAGRPGGCGYG